MSRLNTDSDGPATDTIVAEVREGDYGSRVVAVEPGGAELIPLSDRHGNPVHLLWTWMSPNLEFATIFVGVISIAFFGQTFWQAVAAIVLGTGLGSLAHGALSARGPEFGVPQMILSRISFGRWGNVLPAGLNAVVAGIGWFAVNSVSGAYALASLTDLSNKLCLLIVVAAQIIIAFFGHNLIQSFERYALPLLAVIFVIASLVILSKTEPSSVASGKGGIGGFLLTVGAAFGYAAGWNPYAADYTRYLKPGSGRAAGLYAGLGVFISCVVLEVVGAASVAIPGKVSANPTEAFTGHLPSLIANLTLLAIAVGAVSANVINIYSGTMSFLALGFRLPMALRRAIVALVFGVIGTVVAWSGLHDAGAKYENFLLVISYWIGPWLAVYLTDWVLRRGHRVGGFLFDRRHNPIAGFVAMAVGMVISIWLFSNQTKYVGVVPKAHPKFGDLTFEVGFVISAVLYAVLFKLQHDKQDEVLVIPEARTPTATT
jgi:NCS1 family nucleobase:cation symporter-1